MMMIAMLVAVVMMISDNWRLWW